MARLALSLAFLLLCSSACTATRQSPGEVAGDGRAVEQSSGIETGVEMQNVWVALLMRNSATFDVESFESSEQWFKVHFHFGSLGSVHAHVWSLVQPAGRVITLSANVVAGQNFLGEKDWYILKFALPGDRYRDRTGEKSHMKAKVGSSVQGESFWFSEDDALERNSAKRIDSVEYLFHPGVQARDGPTAMRMVHVVSVSKEHVWTLKAEPRTGFGDDDCVVFEVGVTFASIGQGEPPGTLLQELPQKEAVAAEASVPAIEDFQESEKKSGGEMPEKGGEGTGTRGFPDVATIVTSSVVAFFSVCLFYCVWALSCGRKSAAHHEDDGSFSAGSCNTGSEAGVDLATVLKGGVGERRRSEF